MILKSENYHFHRLDLTRQAGFVVTIYDEDGLRLTVTVSLATPKKLLEKRDKSRDRENKLRCEQAMADFIL